MKRFISFFKSIGPLGFGLIVFCLMLLITQYAAYLSYRLQKDREEQEILQELNRVKDKLQTVLGNALSATSILAFWVRHTEDFEEFDEIAATILESNTCIDVLQITERGVITRVYPLQGNEVVIGYDILADPKTRTEARHAIEKKELYFAGPFELKQGGTAVVGRLPMFRNDEFQGFSAVIIKWENMLDAAGIGANSDKRYIYQLSKADPITNEEIFFLPDSGRFDKDQAISIEVPDGEWKLYVSLADSSLAFLNGIAFAVLGLIFSLVSAFFARYIALQPRKLRLLVFEKTNQITTEQKISESIINSLPGVFYLYDRVGKFVRWNKNFELVSGYNAGEILQMVPLDYFVPVEKELVTRKINEVFEAGESSVAANFLLKDGRTIPYYFTGRKIVLNSKDYLIGVGIDISDRVKAENELITRNEQILELTKNLEKIREDERTRIAREIHDLLGQQLTALKMDIAWVHKKYVTDEGMVNQKLTGMIGIIDETIQTVRRISSELRPSILDDLGLLAAMEWQGKDFATRTGLRFTMHNELVDFNPDSVAATQIFRIFQESLTNITRHANATSVKVFVYDEDGTVCFEITDNGQGFDVSETLHKNTLGFLGMKERALLINGTVTIKSEPGKGTCICIRIPLENK